jgi:hypothetical protein
MVFQELESGAGRKPMKTRPGEDFVHQEFKVMAARSLGAYHQKMYLVRPPAPRGGSFFFVDNFVAYTQA